MRADTVLRELFPGLSRRQIAEAFEKTWVGSARLREVSDKPAFVRPLKKSARLASVEQLDCSKLRQQMETLRAGNKDLGIRVVQEATDFVVIHKPAGIASVPLSLSDDKTVTAWARAVYPQINENFSELQPELAPHRLDTFTEGLLVVCLTTESHVRWREAFSEHQVEKEYAAWIWGVPEKKSFTLSTELLLIPGKARVQRMPDFTQVLDSEEGFSEDFTASESALLAASQGATQDAISHVEVLNAFEGYSQVRVRTSTGVRHQVRAQLAFAGHPLIGDRAYDSQIDSRPFGHPHHLLCATGLKTPFGAWSTVSEALLSFDPCR